MERKVVSHTIRIPVELLERGRNALYHLPQKDTYGGTLTGLFIAGFEQILAELEGKNKGKPFPQREAELPKSRLKPEGTHEEKRYGRKRKEN